MNFQNKRKWIRILALIVLALMILSTLGGCAQDTEQLETYKKNMDTFFDSVASYNASINAIDPMSDQAEKELLGYLDSMNAEFSNMATFPIPEEFQSISKLPKDASDSMANAVSLYHEAYDGEYNQGKAEEARQYYERANRAVQVMIQVLRGKKPEGDDVTVTNGE
jgi:hypothetical protein